MEGEIVDEGKLGLKGEALFSNCVAWGMGGGEAMSRDLDSIKLFLVSILSFTFSTISFEGGGDPRR